MTLAALALAVFALRSDPPPIFLPHETILFQGDSITDGNRGRSEDPNHILGHGYAFSIASGYGEAYPELNLLFVNRGVSGDTLERLAARWQADTLDLKPDVLSVLIGVNDILAAVGRHEALDAEAAYSTYDRLLARAVQARPGIKLVLGEPFVLDVGRVRADLKAWHEAVRALDGVVERLALKYHAPAVRYSQAFEAALRRAPAEHWIWDGIHPTYSGHAIMAKAWIEAYDGFYRSPLQDPARNPAIAPEVNRERDSYDWLHRHDDVLDAQAKADPEIVLVGDSITHFWGGDPKANHVNGPNSWQATFGGRRVLNLGFGWDRTQNVLWRLAHGEMDGLSPKTVVLNIGTNNLVGDATAREDTPAETAAGIVAVVDAILAKAPATHVVVMGVFPRGFERGNPLDERIRELNAIVARSLKDRAGVEFLDIGPELREADGSVSSARFFDGTHPTDAGYALWGAALRRIGALSR